VECTRSRPTRKNDNCSVEQKNSAAVRKIAGYFRCREAAGATALQAVYDARNPLLNRHDPCMKQVRGERVGAEKKRTYDLAKTPFPRLFEQPFEDRLAERRAKAVALKDSTELVEQKQKMDRAVDRLPNGAQDMPVLPRRGTARQG
jgi:hypothetical protein